MEFFLFIVLLIQLYIEDQLYRTVHVDTLTDGHKLKWTGSKSALIELIYALHYHGVFDNGNSDIRITAKYFESTFGIDLGNFYQTYLELRNRKMNRTKFLDALREGLIKKMDEQDEK
ncbi:MAG: RteC domain-containing protein [Agriterribacter sp.]